MPSSEFIKRLDVPWYLSWPVIIVSMIFWPLGILLLVMRLARDRHAGISTGRVLKVAGIVVMLAFAVGGYGYYQEQRELYGDIPGAEKVAVAAAAAFTFFGFILWRFGNRLVYRGKMVREYLDVIVNKRFFGIDEIARIVSKRPDKVVSEIGFLIRTGYLPDAHLSEGAKRVVVPAVERHLAMETDLERQARNEPEELPRSEESSVRPGVPATQERGAVPPVPRLVTCRSCGANNIVIPGVPKECEFCGSPIGE